MMPRNKELLIPVIAATAITALASALSFWCSIVAGTICLIACCCVSALFLAITLRRYRRIAVLSDYLQRLSNGEKALDIRDNAEGELSILKNEIYKVTTVLTEQAESLHEDKAELAKALSDISHQLKTPLTALSVMADLLDDEALSPEKRHEFIDNLRTGLARMDWLVLTLLKLARLDADATELKRSDIRLTELINKSLAPMLIPIEIRGLSINLQGEDAIIVCDPDWTAEALGNIFKNAVEHTPQDGSITVTYGINPLYSFMNVHDGGAGIDKDDLPHLFERFYRGKNANPSSVGIGLSLSLAIMQKQNGDIEVENNNGAAFICKFYC